MSFAPRSLLHRWNHIYHQFEFLVNDPKQYLELNLLSEDCGGDMGDWLGPLGNSIMMALIPLCLLPWCQCAHTKPDPTHPISYWTVIYISTALCSVLGKSLNADKTRGSNCTWCPHCSCSPCWHVMTQMTHYLTTIIGRGQTPALTHHSALDNYVVTRNGATTDFRMHSNEDASGSC